MLACTEVVARETEPGVAEPTKLIAPILARFMVTDRVFEKCIVQLKQDRPAADSAGTFGFGHTEISGD